MLKNEAPRILSEVREEQAEYVVTRRGEPIAVIRPWSGEDERRDREARLSSVLERLDGLADRVAQRAGRRSATAAVAGQRR
jgi:prevent-host-death family protein